MVYFTPAMGGKGWSQVASLFKAPLRDTLRYDLIWKDWTDNTYGKD